MPEEGLGGVSTGGGNKGKPHKNEEDTAKARDLRHKDIHLERKTAVKKQPLGVGKLRSKKQRKQGDASKLYGTEVRKRSQESPV